MKKTKTIILTMLAGTVITFNNGYADDCKDKDDKNCNHHEGAVVTRGATAPATTGAWTEGKAASSSAVVTESAAARGGFGGSAVGVEAGE